MDIQTTGIIVSWSTAAIVTAWGLRRVNASLSRPVSQSKDEDVLSGALRETAEHDDNKVYSTARIAAMIGACVLAGVLSGVGAWLISALYRGLGSNLQLGTVIKLMIAYFACGAALFMPYAFNRFSTMIRNRQPTGEQ